MVVRLVSFSIPQSIRFSPVLLERIGTLIHSDMCVAGNTDMPTGI